MHFGENQLSPCSVGISPLSTTHPPVLQHRWVRASTDCHIRFTLVMDSSHGFGSHRRDIIRLVQTRCPSGSSTLAWINRATCDALAGSFYKRHAISLLVWVYHWPLTAGEYEGSGSLSFPFRGAFHLSLTVLVHYRSHQGLSLGEWSPQLPTPLLVERGTQEPAASHPLVTTGRSPTVVSCSNDFVTLVWIGDTGPTTPDRVATTRFGLVPVRSPLLRESRLISCRGLLRCFSSPLASSSPIDSGRGLQT